MKHLVIIAAGGFLAALPLPAFAGFITGQDLNNWAIADARVKARTATEVDFSDSALLTGYVLGVYDGLALKDPDAWGRCFQAATAGQLESIVAQYVQAHPEQWDKSGALLTTSALIQACKKNLSSE